MSSPTIRSRRARLYDEGCDETQRTPRQKFVFLEGTKTVDAYNRDLRPVGIVSRMLNMFLRRKRAQEKARACNRVRHLPGNGKRVVVTTSRLALKHKIDGKHIIVRQYRKLARGLTGALSWARFDKMRTDKAGHLLMEESPLHRQRREEMHVQIMGPRPKLPKNSVPPVPTMEVPHVNTRHNHKNYSSAGVPCRVTKAVLRKTGVPYSVTASR